MNRLNTIKKLNHFINVNQNSKSLNDPTRLYKEYDFLDDTVADYSSELFGCLDTTDYGDFTFVFSSGDGYGDIIFSETGNDLEGQIEDASEGNNDFTGCFHNKKVIKKLKAIGNHPNELYLWSLADDTIRPAKVSDITPLAKNIRDKLVSLKNSSKLDAGLKI